MNTVKCKLLFFLDTTKNMKRRTSQKRIEITESESEDFSSESSASDLESQSESDDNFVVEKNVCTVNKDVSHLYYI